jgi:hypothetical protein
VEESSVFSKVCDEIWGRDVTGGIDPRAIASPTPGAGKSRDHFLGDPTKFDGILGHKTTFTRIDIEHFSNIFYAFV